MKKMISENEFRAALDRRLAGLKADPGLARRIIAMGRGDRKRKKASVTAILAACLLLIGTATALAAANGWSVIQFLFPGRKAPVDHLVETSVQKEAVSDGAVMRVSSAIYDGRTLAFDWYIENTRPETPMYCRVAEFTANGARIWTDGTDSFDECWIPGLFFENAWQDGELILLPDAVAGAEELHVALRVALYRPERPIARIGGYEAFDPALAAQKIAEGFYVIPGGDGFVAYDEDEKAWVQVFMPRALPTDMGGYRVEKLEISFDVSLAEKEILPLSTEDVYDSGHGSVRYKQADVTPLGLYLSLEIDPTDGYFQQDGSWELTDSTGKALVTPFEGMDQIRREGYASGGTHAEYQWYGLKTTDLPAVISLSWVPREGDILVFPIHVR